uniref:Putative secreted protein n=1 Tax=Ixodes ricinus TaxID=34613 RepID=A0A6B0TZR9_IXORI
MLFVSSCTTLLVNLPVSTNTNAAVIFCASGHWYVRVSSLCSCGGVSRFDFCQWCYEQPSDLFRHFAEGYYIRIIL